jgi:DNA repair protein RadD
MIALYDYQSAAVDAVRQRYRDGAVAPLLVLPTGGGKTVCFTYMAQRAVERGVSVLIVVHRRELVGQVSEALKQWGVRHGCITPSHKPTCDFVQVAMVQTLARRLKMDRKGLLRFGLVIVDEAHHCVAASAWGDVLRHNAGAKFLGVTATPCRLDGKGLGISSGGFFDALVCGPSVSDLVERGRLAAPVVFAPDQSVDLSGVKKRGGDYVSGALASRMDSATLTGDAVLHYRKHCNGAPAIAFTVTTEHAGHVARDFGAAGFQAAVLTGSTPDRDRARMIRDLGAGRLNVLASCNVVSEGTDIPTVTAAILLRPTASYALAMQQMGRALRTAPGKDRAIILDHAGNCHRHGLPTEYVEWTLDGVQRKTADDLKPCYACQSLVPARASVCPACGHVLRTASADRETNPQETLPMVRSGELAELTPELRAAMRRQRLKEERAARSIEELAAVGRRRGYKYPDGWARKRYGELRNHG